MREILEIQTAFRGIKNSILSISFSFGLLFATQILFAEETLDSAASISVQETLASCTKSELSHKICRLKFQDRQIRLSAKRMILSDSLKRSIHDFPETRSEAHWESIEWIKIGDHQLLHVKVWLPASDPPLSIQKLHWWSFQIQDLNLVPFFNLQVSSRRQKKTGGFQLDPLLPIHVYIKEGKLHHSFKEIHP